MVELQFYHFIEYIISVVVILTIPGIVVRL